MNNTKHEIKGVIPAVISPMNVAGDLDIQALEAQLEYLCGTGVHGFLSVELPRKGDILQAPKRSKHWNCQDR